MKISSRAEELLVSHAEAAFDLAVDDTLELARAHAAKHSLTGRFAGSLARTPTVREGQRITALIGSPLSSARVKELGGFITSRTDEPMRFRIKPSGDWVTFPAGSGYRIPAQPAVTRAGGRFGTILRARLGALGIGASGSARAAKSPDFRGGRVDFG